LRSNRAGRERKAKHDRHDRQLRQDATTGCERCRAEPRYPPIIKPQYANIYGKRKHCISPPSNKYPLKT
jgi:hypothetical protein